jgi:hypothetical protein
MAPRPVAETAYQAFLCLTDFSQGKVDRSALDPAINKLMDALRADLDAEAQRSG